MIDKAIRTSTGINSLFPIAHVIDGELYGTTMLAFKKGQAHPSTELLESFAHLMSVSLKRYKAENALKESEIKFRNLFNSMQEGVYLHKMIYNAAGKAVNYRIIEANDISEKILKIKKQEAVGQLATDLFKTEEAPLLEVYSKVAETGLPITFVQYYEPMNRHFLISAFSPKKGEFATAFTDISIQKKNEQELIKAKEKAEESERKFQLLVNQSPSPLAVVDKKLEKVLYWSQSATKKLGHSPKTVSEWYQVAYPDPTYREKVIKKWNKKLKKAAKSQKASNTGEYLVTCKDGSIITVEFYVQLLPDQIIITLNDITERKIAEEALKQSEENLKSIVENGINMFYKHDINHQLKYVSPQVKNILGYEVEEMMLRWTELVTDNPINETGYQYTMKAIKTGERQDVYDLELKHKNGNKILVEVREAPIVKNGKTTEIVGALTDVTEKRKTEQALLIAKEKAEESDRLKTAFLANMSHEIRTPMNGILGFTNLLKETNLSAADQKKYIDIIQKSGDRMLNTVNDIIEISKIEAGEITVTNSKVDVVRKINTLYEFFQNEALEKGLSFELIKVPEGANVTIESDSNKIDSVMSNLIKNAIKYTNKGGIKIGVSVQKNNLVFYCRDTGIGIPKEKHLAIFNRFEQADIENRNAYQGSGLGLSIAKHYADLLGGNLWVESQPEKGSVFYFSIPLNQAEIKAIEKLHKTKEIENEAKANDRKLKTLIVEDDENSSLFLSIIMKDFTSDILLAENGKKAIQIIKEHPDIKLILLDIRMVGMDGIETAKQIRSFNNDVIIIGQSAYAFEEDKKQALEVGFNDYISKPVCKQKLENLINKYFN